LDAQAHVLGPEGKRVLPLDGFFAGPGRSVLARNELLLGFVLPDRLAGAGGSYHKHSWREALDIQMCGAAVVLTADPGDCRCLEARIALGTAGPVPRRADAAEAALKGAVVNEELASELGRIAAAEARPRTSARATEEYRREMIEVLVKRAILDALAHIKGARS